MTAARQRRRASAALWLVAALLFAGFAALGTWQVQRRTWKLDLIARVEQRVHAAPETLAPERWAEVSAANDEYRRLRFAGRFRHDRETLVQAATELGSGFWVLTPLVLPGGQSVLVNRGFIPPAQRARATRAAGEPQGEVTITGLLRITEPGGGFLRRNAPAADRWYSRDVAAIAAARGLVGAAPFFVDAEADHGRRTPLDAESATAARDQPTAGLTVIHFPNSHAVYAITWYALALMVAGGAWRVARELRLRDVAHHR